MTSGNTFFFQWEVSLMEWLQANLGDAGIKVLSFFSAFGEELIMILIIGFLYWCFNKKAGKTIGLSILAAFTWNTLIKNIFLRRRPYFDHEGIEIKQVVEPDADIYDIAAQGYSFPSGHSTNAVSIYWSLARWLKKKWMTVLAVLLPLLVGFSRVVVGAHYPTDVLVGWGLGAAAVFLIPALEDRIKNRAVFYWILVAVAVPGLFYCKTDDYFTAFGLLIGFVCGSLLEEKWVNFENTRKPVWMILRVAGGLVVYVVLNKAMKLPFSEEFLDSGTLAAHMARCVRYAVIAFVEFGVYPLAFRVEKK